MVNNKMDNKEKNEQDKKDKKENEEQSGFVDVAHMDANCHILIKDKDTGQILLNRRG